MQVFCDIIVQLNCMLSRLDDPFQHTKSLGPISCRVISLLSGRMPHKSSGTANPRSIKIYTDQRNPTTMSVRTCIRHSPRLSFLSSLRQSPHRIPPYCIRSLSLSTQEQPKPSVVPTSPSNPPPSSLRETKRPETLHTPPTPPRNDPAPVSAISTPSDQPLPTSSPPTTSTPHVTPSPKAKQEPRFAFKPLKAALSLSPNAISRLKEILDQPEPKLVRVGVKNRGCAGLAYHLEYVDKPGKFDEIVEQDGTYPFVYM